MLGVLFALTVITAIAVHHFLIERPRRRAAEAERPRPSVPLPARMGEVPRGVFLQPTYTWSQLRSNGELLVGVHPLLLGLVGEPHQMELLVHAGRAKKGAPLIRVERGNRSLVISSPISGRVLEAKRAGAGELRWRDAPEPNGEWFCRIEPEGLEDEIPAWMIADKAAAWTRYQYGEIRDHLMRVGSKGELGLALADGGEIPIGILDELDESDWETFQQSFLRS